MAEFTVNVPDGPPLTYSGSWGIGKGGVLRVTQDSGYETWYSPSGWHSVEEDKSR